MRTQQNRIGSFLLNIVKVVFSSLFLIIAFWVFFKGLHLTGFPCPQIPLEKFFDLAFFSISAFSLIIFLTMIPLQIVEGNLSPGFLAKITNTPKAHFGLYVLIFSAALCFLVPALQRVSFLQNCISELFLALLASIVFAILYIRRWVLRCLDQPYIVYNYIQELQWEEPLEKTWLELLECTLKAVKQGRIHDATRLVELLAIIYREHKGDKALLKEDLEGLYKLSSDLRPIARVVESKWPFLLSKDSEPQETPLEHKSVEVPVKPPTQLETQF